MSIVKIQQGFRFFLRKTFDIREGELERALLMQLNIFLIITTLLIVKPTVNGLFLSKFGVESLPYAFILVAIAAAIVSTIFSRLLNRYPLNRLMVTTLYGSVVSLLIFGIFLRFNILENLTLYLFYIWVSIFALITTSQFWVLANIIFNAREAKRLFGFIGSGAIIGGIFGGYLTSVLSLLFSSEYLPLICALFLGFCIPITKRIWKNEVVGQQTVFQQKKKTPKDHHPLQQILQSRHLTYIAAIVGVSVVVAKLVDYQFAGVASSIIQDPDELTAFFGFWFSTFNVISLLMQLFVTRRVVGTFGVGSSLFILPVSILFAAILLLFMPELLLAAVFLKMSDGGLKQSVNKAAMELLILPIPQEVKNQTKTFIDVFIDSLATGFSGLLLIFVIKALNLSATAINILIVLLLVAWLYLASRVKGEYFKSFRQKISFGKEPKKRDINLRDASVIGGIKKVLSQGSDKQILYLLLKIQEVPDDRLFDEVRLLMQHPLADIRAEAIRNLYFYRNRKIPDEVAQLANDPSQKVKIAVFDYLLTYGTDNGNELIHTYLAHEDYHLSYAALVSLARETRNNYRLRSLFQLETLLRERITNLDRIKDEQERSFCTIGLIKAVGYSSIKSLYDFIELHLQSDQEPYVQQAIKSAGDTLDPRFLDQLIEFLGAGPTQSQAREALLNYGPGIIEILIVAARDSRTPLGIVRAIPSVIKQIDSQKSVDFMFELFDYSDSVVRQEALRGLNRLRNAHPYLSFNKETIITRILDEAKLFQETLSALYAQNKLYQQTIGEINQHPNGKNIMEARSVLINLLEKRLDRNLERIFRLLGLKHSSSDIFSIYKALHSTTPDIRLNAIEFLDNLLEPGLKKVLIPIVEHAMLEPTSLDTVNQLNLTIPNEQECLKMLLHSPDAKIKQSVLFLIQEIRDPTYLDLLKNIALDQNQRFLPLIKETIEVLEK